MFRGSLVALVTPMTASGDVDHVAFGRLLDWHARQGTDGIVVAGTTGESPTVSAAEIGGAAADRGPAHRRPDSGHRWYRQQFNCGSLSSGRAPPANSVSTACWS